MPAGRKVWLILFCYVLFVKTGYENRILDEINTMWKIDGLRPFMPMYDCRFRKSGELVSERRCLFPGYIFIETDIKGRDFAERIRPAVLLSRYVWNLLKNDSDMEHHSFEMREEEYQTFLKLYNSEHCIEMSQGFIAGDLIKIIDGPLVGFESSIKKINRHKMEAVVEIEMMGRVHDVKVGLEVIEKLP